MKSRFRPPRGNESLGNARPSFEGGLTTNGPQGAGELALVGHALRVQGLKTRRVHTSRSSA
jgi:hypothetical protein